MSCIQHEQQAAIDLLNADIRINRPDLLTDSSGPCQIPDCCNGAFPANKQPTDYIPFTTEQIGEGMLTDSDSVSILARIESKMDELLQLQNELLGQIDQPDSDCEPCDAHTAIWMAAYAAHQRAMLQELGLDEDRALDRHLDASADFASSLATILTSDTYKGITTANLIAAGARYGVIAGSGKWTDDGHITFTVHDLLASDEHSYCRAQPDA